MAPHHYKGDGVREKEKAIEKKMKHIKKEIKMEIQYIGVPETYSAAYQSSCH